VGVNIEMVDEIIGWLFRKMTRETKSNLLLERNKRRGRKMDGITKEMSRKKAHAQINDFNQQAYQHIIAFSILQQW
jgi:hypothetical protein